MNILSDTLIVLITIAAVALVWVAMQFPPTPPKK